MALVSMRQLLDHAAENGYGLPAFNVNNMEHIPAIMHQDHGASPTVCQRSIRSGFTSVMMDGSLREDMKTPASYDYNVAVTRKVVEMAHAVGVSVEAELGCLGSLETGEAGEEDGSGAEGALSRDQLLTDPEQAADFVKQTGVDALAIAIGTSHGAYKFSRKPTGDILAIDRVKQIHERIPNTHLVMHGSSSVPQEWLEIIRAHGGRIKETYGVPVEEIREGIRHGVRKARFEAFGSAGQASRITPIPLARMCDLYAAGRLQQVVH